MALGAGLGACSGKAKPEADPAKAQALAKAILDNAPAPAAVPTCTPQQLAAAPTVTQTTLLRLAGMPVPADPERADWINPAELDPPAARTLVDAAADTRAKRQAAAELLALPGFVVIRVDLVQVPLALEVKELKRGAMGVRAIAYDKRGMPVCVQPFTVQNDKQLAEWAMQKSDKAVVDPAIAQKLRDDLRAQLITKIGELRTVPTK